MEKKKIASLKRIHAGEVKAAKKKKEAEDKAAQKRCLDDLATKTIDAAAKKMASAARVETTSPVFPMSGITVQVEDYAYKLNA